MPKKIQFGEFVELIFTPEEEVVEKLTKEIIPNILETLWSRLEGMLNQDLFKKISETFENEGKSLASFTNPALYKGRKHTIYVRGAELIVDDETKIPIIDSSELEAKYNITIGKSKINLRAYLFLGEIE